MIRPGSKLLLLDNALKRESNYWFSLQQQGQEVLLGTIGPDGLWDVVFTDAVGTPHLIEGVSPERFKVTKYAPAPKRWWQFWRKSCSSSSTPWNASLATWAASPPLLSSPAPTTSTRSRCARSCR